MFCVCGRIIYLSAICYEPIEHFQQQKNLYVFRVRVVARQVEKKNNNNIEMKGFLIQW